MRQPTHVNSINVLIWEVLNVKLPLDNQLVKGSFVYFTSLPCWWHWDEGKNDFFMWRGGGERWRWLLEYFFYGVPSCSFFGVESMLRNMPTSVYLNFHVSLTWQALLEELGENVLWPENLVAMFELGNLAQTWHKLGTNLAQTWHKLGIIKCHSCSKSYTLSTCQKLTAFY